MEDRLKQLFDANIILSNPRLDATELDANLLLNEQLIELADSLEQLKQKERDLIILYYYKEMTLKEVAVLMGMSYANAKVLHKKALKKLNEMMAS